MLELYAGSGAMSLEALSRGASHCIAVEQSSGALRQLQENALQLGGELETVKASLPAQWPAVARRLTSRLDLIFLDPPYREGVSQELLAALVPVLDAGGRVAVEHSRRIDLEVPEPLIVQETRRYGETAITYLARTR